MPALRLQAALSQRFPSVRLRTFGIASVQHCGRRCTRARDTRVATADVSVTISAPDALDDELDMLGIAEEAELYPAGTRAMRALVLDVSYRPVDVIQWQRAMVLDLLGKIDVLEHYETAVRSATREFLVPAVVRIRAFVDPDIQTVALTRRNILARDRFRCVYCGSSRNLTIDHVMPVSRGGAWVWGNLVAACSVCNQRKGDKTLEEIGWKLQQTNGVRVGLLSLAGRMRVSEFIDTPHQWKDYLGQGVLEEFAGIVNGLLSSQREAAAARKASKKPRGKRPGAGQAKRVARKAPRALGRPSMS